MKKLTSLSLVIVILVGLLSACTVFADSVSSSEQKAAEKVYYIADREFTYYEKAGKYLIRFSLKDADEERMACPCTVEARLVNSEGVEVYSVVKDLTWEDFTTWTWSYESYSYLNGIYGSIYIDPEEIIPGSSSSGTMYIKVYSTRNSSGKTFFTFSEKAIEVDELPTTEPTMVLPSVPLTVHSRNDKYAINITNLSCEYKKNTYNDDGYWYIYVTGEMTQGSTTTANKAYIGWRLLDSEGYVIDTGTWYTDSLFQGDKFRNKEFNISCGIGDYQLQIIDVS